MIIAIVGPTGIGKTALSISLAKHYNAEIINFDAMQVYEKMDIVMRIMYTLLSGLVCPTPGHAIFHGCRRPRFIRTSNPSRKKNGCL